MTSRRGLPKFESSQALPDFAYDEYARMIGLKGMRMDSPEAVGPVWDEALRADRPVMINAVVDANVPPLPPHMDFGQAKSFMASIYKSDPEAGSEIGSR